MAKSGFVPAWMKIPSSDKTNVNQKFNLNRSNHPTIKSGRQRHHSSDLVNHTMTRHTLFYNAKPNGKTCRCRLVIDHHYGKKSNEQQPSEHFFSFHFRPASTDMTIKSNDRLGKDFSLVNRPDFSSNHNDQSSIWNHNGSKFHLTNNENLSRAFGSTRKDRLLSTPNSFLRTNCITQTKNLNKRSDFFNSLKNDLTIERNKTPYNQFSKLRSNSNQLTKQTLVLLSVPETLEEKDFLIRMGWNDDMTYEITDKDKEEYEKRIKFLPRTENRSARLISALHRRTLPCINIRDILQLEMIGSASDDDNSDD